MRNILLATTLGTLFVGCGGSTKTPIQLINYDEKSAKAINNTDSTLLNIKITEPVIKKAFDTSEVWRDSKTSLMWEKKTEENIKKEYFWKEANNYCSNLELSGYSDWRLGTTDELKNLLTEYYGNWDNWSNLNKWLDKNKYKRNNRLFVRDKISKLLPEFSWTSSINRTHNYRAWVVDFNDAYDYSSNKTNSHYVVCVRNSI